MSTSYHLKAFLLGFGLTFILVSPALAEKVIYVIDGDTVILDNHDRVRLIGINSPEIASDYHRGEYYGKDAKKYLKKRIEGKEVVLKDGQEARDKYDRRLAYIYLSDGTFINEELVRLGYAETFRTFPFTYKEQFLKLEEEAREKQIGMWSSRKRPWWLSSFKKKRPAA